MTFRRSLYFSFAAHILFFGCAIAIANYGRGTISSLSRVIQVSLVSSVSSDPGPGREAGIVSRPQHLHQPASSQASEPPVEYQNMTPEYMPADPAPASLSTTETSGTAEISTGHTEGGGQVTATASTGSVSGSEAGFGLIPPERWSSIVSAIERTKNYPRLARERGIEGVVRLRFRINSDGAIEKIEIVESSGSEILDKASIRAVYRAAPMPAVSGWIEIPIKYLLK